MDAPLFSLDTLADLSGNQLSINFKRLVGLKNNFGDTHIHVTCHKS